jgi:hypothetical protein
MGRIRARAPYRSSTSTVPSAIQNDQARVYRIDDKNRIVTVVDADNRRDVYRT